MIHSHCLNCLSELQGKFCHQCGQRDAATDPSTREWLRVFWDDYVSLDAKLINSLKGLFIPGKLTLEWMAGRQESYIPPFRFYIFWTFLLTAISFVFFGGEHTIVDSILRDRVERDGYAEIVNNRWFEAIIQFSSVLFVPAAAIAADLLDKRRHFIFHCIFCCHLWLSIFTIWTLTRLATFLFRGLVPDGDFLISASMYAVHTVQVIFIYFSIHKVYRLSWPRTFYQGTKFIAAGFFTWIVFSIGSLWILILLS